MFQLLLVFLNRCAHYAIYLFHIFEAVVVVSVCFLHGDIASHCCNPVPFLHCATSDALIFQAESLTGITNPIQAGQELLKKGVHTRWVIIKMGGKGSILITNSSIICAPAFKVIFLSFHHLFFFTN